MINIAARTVSARVMVEGEEQYKKSMQALSASNSSFGQSAGQLGDQMQALSSKLGVQLPEGATKALNSISGFSAGTVTAMAGAAAAIAAVVKVCKELHEITLQAAHDADELLTKSMQTGVSTQTLQQWQYASQLIDVSVETMTGSMTKLTRSMASAQSGSASAVAAFDALGISITDGSGQLKSAEEVFYEAIDALGQVGNQTERDALAMEIFGKSAQELNPLILQGSEALREYGEEAEAVGYVLDESQIKKLGEVDDAYQKMQAQIEAAKKELAVAFAPVSQAALELVTKAVGSLTSAIEKMSEAASKAARLVKSLLGINDPQKGYGTVGWDVAGAEWKDDVQAWVTKGGTIITPDIIDQIDKTTGALKNQFYLGPADDVATYVTMSEDEIRKLLAGVNASGNDNWRGGLTWVGEAGPELVALPQGSRIYSNQDSRQLGGDTIYNITVANVQQLDEIIDWYESRRTRGRMM